MSPQAVSLLALAIAIGAAPWCRRPSPLGRDALPWYLIRLSLHLSLLLAILFTIWSRLCQSFIQAMVSQAFGIITRDSQTLMQQLIVDSLPGFDTAWILRAAMNGTSTIPPIGHSEEDVPLVGSWKFTWQSLLPFALIVARKFFA